MPRACCMRGAVLTAHMPIVTARCALPCRVHAACAVRCGAHSNFSTRLSAQLATLCCAAPRCAQVYELSQQFLPKDWIMEKWEEGFYITAMAGKQLGRVMCPWRVHWPWQPGQVIGDAGCWVGQAGGWRAWCKKPVAGLRGWG